MGICGASAALAVSAILPHGEEDRRATVVTIAGMTGLSTSATIL